jgi:diketogulonate reductase-like aldo/keto reductase
MAMSGYYLDPNNSDAESIRTIQRALDLGVTHIDTAEIYGPYANEELVPLDVNNARRARRSPEANHARAGVHRRKPVILPAMRSHAMGRAR